MEFFGGDGDNGVPLNFFPEVIRVPKFAKNEVAAFKRTVPTRYQMAIP